jgi:hypothetical protein
VKLLRIEGDLLEEWYSYVIVSLISANEYPQHWKGTCGTELLIILVDTPRVAAEMKDYFHI